jgi:cobalt-zinc-cadmium efflux system protein
MHTKRNDLLSELITKRETNSLLNKNTIIYFFILCSAGIVFVGGLFSNSLIIMMDGIYDLWSLIGLITYILNKKLQKRLPDNKFNFGYYRGECIGGLLSLIFFWIFSFEFGVLSIKRLFEIEEVNAIYMIISAIICIFVNILNSCFIHYKVRYIFPLGKRRLYL